MSQFVCFEAAGDNEDVTLENDNCEGETRSDIDVVFITILSIMRVLRIIMRLKVFLESMMIQLEILLLDLIFHKSQAIIALMMISVMK